MLFGWGRTAPTRAAVYVPRHATDVGELLAGADWRAVIARGLGRSYGDAAQNAGGRVLAMTALHEIGDLDAAGACIRVDAGVSLGELARYLVPRGWWLPVVPGTRHVTVGGAIASDVHGKSHHRDGSFAAHVASVDLCTPVEGPVTISAEREPEALRATAGGMGLTGVILGATLRLRQIETAWMRVDIERANDLDDAMAHMQAGDARSTYSVAWIDLLARGRRLGRCVLSHGEHATMAELPPARAAASFATPASRWWPAPPSWTPSGLLRSSAVRAFNAAWFHRAPTRERGRLEPLPAFFWPLDAARDWNRLYGPHGLIQYQLAVPVGAEDTLRQTVQWLASARCPALLGVLKRLGTGRGLLSFPQAGWTLSVDVPAATPGLGALLDRLDELVVAAGGRVYLAKDARLRPELLSAMYPQLARWRELRGRLDPDRQLGSDLARRLGL